MISNEYDPDEAAIRAILETAGKRPDLPPEDLAAIKDAARTVWRTRYAQTRPRWNWRWWLVPLAASLVVAAGLSWWKALQPVAIEAPVVAAEVERAIGIVIAANGDDEPSQVVTSQPLAAGAVVETEPDGRVALRLTGGQSLRLDAATRARLVSPRIVELERGAVYLDSSPGQAVTVRTFAGDFHPAGTQFEVRIADDRSVRLRVREGQVRLHRKGDPVTAVAGDEVIVQNGTISRGTIATDDPDWSWVVESAPMIDIEGRTLRAFLDWIAREKGWKVAFASPEADALSRTITLHGSIDRQNADEALRTVMLSSGFDYRIANGVLTVDRAR